MMQQADELKPPSLSLATAVNTHTEGYQSLMAEHVTLSASHTSLKSGCGSGKMELTTYPQTVDSFLQM